MKPFRIYERAKGAKKEEDRLKKVSAISYFSYGIDRLMKATTGFFHKSVYAGIPSQESALREVYALLERSNGTVLHTEIAEHSNSEFAMLTKASFDIHPSLYVKCFKNPVDPNHTGVVEVLFYTGLSEQIKSLITSNTIVDEVFAQLVPEDSFDAMKVLPLILRNAKAERMSVMAQADELAGKKQWFQLPSGSIVGVEVSGYATVLAGQKRGITPRKRYAIGVTTEGKTYAKQL